MTDHREKALHGEVRRYKRETGAVHKLLNEAGIEGRKRGRILGAVETLMADAEAIRDRAASLCEEFPDGTDPKTIADHIREMPISTTTSGTER